MLELPMSNIVSVNIAVSAQAATTEGFGTLLIVTNDISVLSTAERIRSYSTISGVTADWGSDSEVTAAATAYFSQSPTPDSLMVAVRYEDAQAASILGGSVSISDIDLFTAVSSGGFTVSIDGVSSEVLGIDLSGATTMEGIALLIQTAIQAIGTGGFTAATFTYDGSAFILTSGTTGETSLLSWLTAPTTGTDISSLIEMMQGEGNKTDGLDAETITASLSAIDDKNSDWYGFMFTKEIRDDAIVNLEDAVEAAATWAEARTKLFFTVSNDEDVLKSTSINDIAYTLSLNDLARTFMMYSSYPTQYPEASAAGRAFTVDFTSGNPSITLKFKTLPNITVESLTTSQKNVLDSKYCNSYVNIAGNYMLSEGWMIGGRYFDEVHGLDWLENNIQVAVINALYTRTSKLPYTDKGILVLVQAVSNALEQGVTANLLAPGYDSDENYLSTGYSVSYVATNDVSVSDKESRYYSGISFVALGSGAIHKIVINGTFER